MTASPVALRARRLAGALGELKAKVRAALATELAGAVGQAVRDVLLGALADRALSAPRSTGPTRVPSRAPGWRDEDRRDEGRRTVDAWGYPLDPWAEPDDPDERDRFAVRDSRADREPFDEDTEELPMVRIPATAVAAGVSVGRWWLSKNGTAGTALGLGALAAGLGLAGGPVARALLAVLAVAGDVLSAESALARVTPS